MGDKGATQQRIAVQLGQDDLRYFRRKILQDVLVRLGVVRGDSIDDSHQFVEGVHFNR